MKRLTTAILVSAALACIWLAGSLHEPLIDMRADYGLTQAEPLENAPPLVAFTTVALGGFRGLLVDALWMRLSRLQSEGKYFELVQLADWITKLEPRSSSIWAFQAWNLSYNISVFMSSEQDRWRWVHHGISLLRDEGLVYNRGSGQLYRELGWLFQHKVGSDSDQAHWHYKTEWFNKMDALLGGPRPDFATLDQTPEGRDIARRMREEFKMEPEMMRRIEDEYGPLDWRIPESQAIYWAFTGLRYSRTDFDTDSLSRMIFQSLVALFQTGNYIFRDGHLIDRPDLDIFPHVDKAFQNAFASGTRNPSFDEAYHNFLLDAIILHFYYQRDEKARAIFDQLAALNLEQLEDQTYESLIAALNQQQIDDMLRHRVLGLIDSILLKAAEYRLDGNESAAENFETAAVRNWNAYMSMRTEENFRLRTGLPPLDILQEIAAEEIAARRTAPQP